MRGRLAWAVAALGLAGAVAYYRALKSRSRPAPAAADPAEALRRKLAESRTVPEEPGRPDTETDLAARRRRVHERGRAAAEEMRRPTGG